LRGVSIFAIVEGGHNLSMENLANFHRRGTMEGVCEIETGVCGFENIIKR
jgi:hypothetical protein